MRHTPGPADHASNEQWIQDTETCVLCGLCLPHCPTYQLFQNEGDSPRGRILLIRALAKSEIVADTKLLAHLDSCLTCHNCESVCPAKVPFSRIMDRARQHLAQTAPKLYAPLTLPFWIHLFAQKRRLRRWFGRFLWFYHHSATRQLFKKISFFGLSSLKKLDALLPDTSPWMRHTPATSMHTQNKLPKVSLFSGCAGEIFDVETLQASKTLLHAIGLEADIPRNQVCCGALYQHAGDTSTAEQLLTQNKHAFRNTSLVVSCASGCGLQLSEHAKQLNIEHKDIHTLLLHNRHKLCFMECHQRVSLHTPCTLRSFVPEELLHCVPGLYVKRLGTSTSHCCGAAGANLFTHPHTAERLIAPLLDELERQKTSILLSTNIGCILHFRRGIAQRNSNIRVMHPSVFLAQCLMPIEQP